jgi:hypothetical protein
MGFAISHGGTTYTYSYTGIAEFGEALKAQANWKQWRRLKTLFARRREAYFEISPNEAALIGQTLVDVAGRLPAADEAMARKIGASALRAARAREPWVWS